MTKIQNDFGHSNFEFGTYLLFGIFMQNYSYSHPPINLADKIWYIKNNKKVGFF